MDILMYAENQLTLSLNNSFDRECIFVDNDDILNDLLDNLKVNIIILQSCTESAIIFL